MPNINKKFEDEISLYNIVTKVNFDRKNKEKNIKK